MRGIILPGRAGYLATRSMRSGRVRSARSISLAIPG